VQSTCKLIIKSLIAHGKFDSNFLGWCMAEALYINETLKIPFEELEFSASRSSGPGGQNVQKTSTRVTVRWSITDSRTLNEWQRARLLQKLATRITSLGELIVSAESSRSQLTNKRLATERLAELVRGALYVAALRKKTRPTKGSVERRLTQKRRTGAKKSTRQTRLDGD
jgi:ribosome-associated protein